MSLLQSTTHRVKELYGAGRRLECSGHTFTLQILRIHVRVQNVSAPAYFPPEWLARFSCFGMKHIPITLGCYEFLVKHAPIMHQFGFIAFQHSCAEAEIENGILLVMAYISVVNVKLPF